MNIVKAWTPEVVEVLVQHTESSFTPDVANYPLLERFKMQIIEMFDRMKDQLDHLETYRSLMMLHIVPDKIMRRAFATTLRGMARHYLNKLKPSSINIFGELSTSFILHFIEGWPHRRPPTYLLNVKQSRGETFREYVNRFTKESLQIDNVDDKVALTAFMGRLQSSQFLFALSKETPMSMVKLLARAQCYMNAKDTALAWRSEEDRQEDRRDEQRRRDSSSKEKRAENPKKNRMEKVSVRDRLGPRISNGPAQKYIPLNTSVEQILFQIQDERILRWLGKMKTHPNKRSGDKYCRFHGDYDHNTED